jgi:hypothetical protein
MTVIRTNDTETYVSSGYDSKFRFRVIKSKAFWISQALEDANIDASALALGLANFKKLLAHGKKTEEEEKGNKSRNKRTYVSRNFICRRNIITCSYYDRFQEKTKSPNLRPRLATPKRKRSKNPSSRRRHV